ncbi:hypothetical protein PO909_015433 [Leuciscus waleckii]
MVESLSRRELQSTTRSSPASLPVIPEGRLLAVATHGDQPSPAATPETVVGVSIGVFLPGVLLACAELPSSCNGSCFTSLSCHQSGYRLCSATQEKEEEGSLPSFVSGCPRARYRKRCSRARYRKRCSRARYRKRCSRARYRKRCSRARYRKRCSRARYRKRCSRARYRKRCSRARYRKRCSRARYRKRCSRAHSVSTASAAERAAADSAAEAVLRSVSASQKMPVLVAAETMSEYLKRLVQILEVPVMSCPESKSAVSQSAAVNAVPKSATESDIPETATDDATDDAVSEAEMWSVGSEPSSGSPVPVSAPQPPITPPVMCPVLLPVPPRQESCSVIHCTPCLCPTPDCFAQFSHYSTQTCPDPLPAAHTLIPKTQDP